MNILTSLEDCLFITLTEPRLNVPCWPGYYVLFIYLFSCLHALFDLFVNLSPGS